MILEDLARERPWACSRRAPTWALGCFHRRSITYSTGAEDVGTRVVWIQSYGLTADLRIPADRPDVAGRGGFADCTREELIALAKAEGGVADTAFDGRMSWDNWAAVQPYDKWPEAGELRRVGSALIEFAPSGVYAEDWRLQAGSSGLLAGLRLLAEGPPGGPLTPRDGGLVIAGDHAILALGRTTPLPPTPLSHLMESARDPHAFVATAFEARVSYAVRARGAYMTRLSTDPFREGAVLGLGGFTAVGEDRLMQTTDQFSRLWRIDTLLADVDLAPATAARADGLSWLAREAPYLAGV